ncbi:MAG: MBL fold hydrolase [Candidatus Parcubacteria bacterium]|nr:MAG: MBL fold hydrolase [Candidatus Parcubacteria bacterium]
MKIYFYGGAQEVTGSNFLLESKSKILIDCGLVQKEKVCSLENFLPFPYHPSEIKAVLITHAHLDHIGRLPKLLKEGFRGYIYSTLPTKDLAYEILLDSQKLIEENCREFNKENLYQKEDVEKLMLRWQTVDYHQKLNLDDLEIEFYNAGHILGSAFIKITQISSDYTQNRGKLSIVFSGDLGNKGKSLNQHLEDLPWVNYLVLESTYGNRNHQNLVNRKEILEEILEKVIYERRILIIPTFALERAQEIIFDIQQLIEKKKIPEIKIFLDSPLAFRISQIYEKYHEYLNQESAREILTQGIFNKEYLTIVQTKEDERKMFLASEPKIILAGSGMVTGGRILKIFKNYLEDKKTTILFVGYQAQGSLGRKILEGEKEIFLDGQKINVKAEISTLFSYSAHIDQQGILEWLYPQRFNLKTIFLIHGDTSAKQELKTKIMDELTLDVIIPEQNDFFEI